MKTRILCLASLVLAPALAAQAVAVATDTVYGVFARNGNLQDHQAIPASTAISTATSVAASVLGAEAGTKLTPLVPSTSKTMLGIQIQEGGTATLRTGTGRLHAGTTPSDTSRTVQPGPHSLVMRIANQGTTPLVARIAVLLEGRATQGAKAALEVDLGNDKTVEFSQAIDGQTHTKEFPVVIQTSLVVKITTEAIVETTSAGQNGYALTAQVELLISKEPPPFEFSKYGKGCGELDLSGADRVDGRLHNVTLKQTGAFPASPGFLLLGARAVDLPIPGIDCRLYVNALMTVPFSSDATGSTVLVLPVPAPLFGTAYAQGTSFTITPVLRVETSNGLKIVCNG